MRRPLGITMGDSLLLNKVGLVDMKTVRYNALPRNVLAKTFLLRTDAV